MDSGAAITTDVNRREIQRCTFILPLSKSNKIVTHYNAISMAEKMFKII
jgi:hypothetical protein